MPTAPSTSRSSRRRSKRRAARAGATSSRTRRDGSIVGSAAFARHLVRLERRDALPHIVIRSFATGAETAVSFPEDAYSLGLGEVAEQDTAVMRFTYSSMTTPTETYDYDMETGERDPAQAPGGPLGPRSRRLRHAPHPGQGAGRSRGAGLDPLPAGHAARRVGAAAALRLRRLRLRHPGLLRHQAPVAGRPRLRLCHRPCPRRHRQGLGLVHGRQARPQGQHVRRFHRRRACSGRGGIHRRKGASWRMAAAPAAC